MALRIRQTVSANGDTLYWPAQEQPRGGIMCLHGSEGGFSGWNDLNCALFAAHGFVALSRNYTQNFRWLVHPDIDSVPLEASEHALFALKAELAPYNVGMGLFGVSRGAEHALLLVQLLAEDSSPAIPDAVAVHSPPDETWPAFLVSDFTSGKPWAGDRTRPAWSWRDNHDRTRPGLLLGVKSTPYPVLITQGTNDEVWGDEMARRLADRMSEAGRPPEARFFSGEGHIF